MEKVLIEKENVTENLGIVVEQPVDEMDLEKQEVASWEKLMKR